MEHAKQLMIIGANPCKMDWSGFDSICYAIKNRNPDLLQTLLHLCKGDIDYNKHFTATLETYLIMAAKAVAPVVIKILLNKGADPNI